MSEIEYMWDELSDNVAAEYEDGVLSAAYTHEPGLYGNLLTHNRNGVTSYYHYDGRGDTVALTVDAGNVTDTKEYDAWGNVIASTGSTVTPYQFVGRQGYQTSNTGVYVRARIYQPTVARWLSVDPLTFYDGMNQFLYAGVNSTRLIDPSGNSATPCEVLDGPAMVDFRLGIFKEVREGKTYLKMGAQFSVVTTFATPCDCCDFDQNIKWDTTTEYIDTLGEVESKEVKKTRFEEDCTPDENGIMRCLGDRKNVPNNRWLGCTLFVYDSPGQKWELQTLRDLRVKLGKNSVHRQMKCAC